MKDDKRAVLEGIAFGDDPKVTPADRLRALEQLRELEHGPDQATIEIAREVAAMSEAELAFEFAGFMAPIGDEASTPAMTEAEVERRVQTHIDQMVAAGQLVRPTVDDDLPEPADAVDDTPMTPEPPTEPRLKDSRGVPLPPGVTDPAALDAAWGETPAQRRARSRYMRGERP